MPKPDAAQSLNRLAEHAAKHLFACESRKETRPKTIAG
jgi:hypothetical protein